MVGEAEARAVVARDAPAPGERGGAGVEVGLEGGGRNFMMGEWRDGEWRNGEWIEADEVRR